uniref:Chemokine interleukin-8-like domain-containing protein n=1 Tax=Electrophorus electricus TaxID=8005 RepID=A0A4W4GB92_ELEEL
MPGGQNTHLTSNDTYYKNIIECFYQSNVCSHCRIRQLYINEQVIYLKRPSFNHFSGKKPSTELSEEDIVCKLYLQSYSVSPLTSPSVTLLTKTTGIPLHKEPRCRCIKNQKKEIPHHKIKKLDIFSANYICKKDEIIATLKKRELKICLSPLEEWVKTLFKMVCFTFQVHIS